jgi:hypothetical protein
MNCVTVGEIERRHSSYHLLMTHLGETTVLLHFLLLLEGDLWVVLILNNLKQKFSKKIRSSIEKKALWLCASSTMTKAAD